MEPDVRSRRRLVQVIQLRTIVLLLVKVNDTLRPIASFSSCGSITGTGLNDTICGNYNSGCVVNVDGTAC